MPKSKSPTQAMYAAIGRTASESAVVEGKLREVFGLLIDSPYGEVIAAGEDISKLVVMCLRVARYNDQLTEAQLKGLILICKAVDSLRDHRNFLVHATWYKLDQPGEHLGLRSSRVSTAPAGQETSEGLRWNVTDALATAESFATISEHIDRFVDDAFPRPHSMPPMTRATKKKSEETWGKLLAGWQPVDPS